MFRTKIVLPLFALAAGLFLTCSTAEARAIIVEPAPVVVRPRPVVVAPAPIIKVERPVVVAHPRPIIIR